MLKRNNQVVFHVDTERHDQLKEDAKKCKLSVSGYIRFLIHGYVPKPVPPAVYFAMMRELYAIENDLQQIAARAEEACIEEKDTYRKNAENLRTKILEIQKAVSQPEKIDGNDKDMGG